MRTLLIGTRSQLGQDLIAQKPAGIELRAVGSDEVDVCRDDSVRAVFESFRPEAVINCAAYHVVDDCEDQEARAFAVNAVAVKRLAQSCQRHGARLVHFSTDYVFSGEGSRPWRESDIPRPRSVYGCSKLAGEFLALQYCARVQLFRVCGLYGVAGSAGKGTNFPKTMLRMAREGRPIRVVEDQILTPTWTGDLARAVWAMVAEDRFGLFHLTAQGQCSWHEFARRLFALAGLTPDLTPCASEAFPTRAWRPRFSVLANARLEEQGLSLMRPWDEALAEYVTAELERRRQAGSS